MAADPCEGLRGGAGGGVPHDRVSHDRWSRLDSELVRIGTLAQTRSEPAEVCGTVLTEVAPLVNAQVGAFFLRPAIDTGPPQWRRIASYGLVGAGDQDAFSPGEGLVGQAAASGRTILLRDVPADYLLVRSGTGSSAPAAVVVQPVSFEDEVLGVLELGSLTAFSDPDLTFLERLVATVAVTLRMIRGHQRTAQRLAQSRCRVRQLEERIRRYEQISRAKSEFLATARRELRTCPGARGASAAELLAWFDDILDLATADGVAADRSGWPPAAPVAVSEIRRHVEHTCGSWARERGLRFRVEIAEGTPEYVVTDVARLRRLLCSLLSEGMRRTGADDPPGAILRIEPGPPGALDTAERVVACTLAHSGFGLAVSRELARMLGGAITVNAGSTCSLYLPAGYQSAEPASGEARGPAERNPVGEYSVAPVLRAPPEGVGAGVAPVRGLDGSTVLIIDDDVRGAFELTSILELHGLRVFYADNSADGLRILAEHPEVDVVLMDASVPDLDGNRTTRAIRELPGGSRLPVVFITAEAMPCGREFSVAAGATDCITKPVDLDELLAALSTWVARFRDASDEE